MLPQVSIFTYMCVCVCCVLRIELATWQRRRRSRRRVADTFVVVVVAVFFLYSSAFSSSSRVCWRFVFIPLLWFS